jgi:hypothetical protein
MAEDVKKPAIIDMICDIRHMGGYLVDLEPGARQGMRVTTEEFPGMAEEIIDNQPVYGERAGISAKDAEAFISAVERKRDIDTHLRVARKMVEVLEETGAVEDDKAQRLAYGFAQTIEARARAFGDPELLARYEKTRAYRSAAGFKAAKTRRRNEADQEQPGNDEQPGDLPDDETRSA